MEQVVRRENLVAAYARVVRNGGAPGVDGMTVDELDALLPRALGADPRGTAERKVRAATRPGVEIPKPAGRARGCSAFPRCWTD